MIGCRTVGHVEGLEAAGNGSANCNRPTPVTDQHPRSEQDQPERRKGISQTMPASEVPVIIRM